MPGQVGGIVLCGGKSSRMGRPKAWLPFGGEYLLPRIVRIVSEAATPVVVVAARGQSLPPCPAPLEIVHDEVEGRGPLQGLAAGLKALQGRAEAAFLASCDIPLLEPRFIRRMIEMLGDHSIAVPFSEGRLHPLAAVYRLKVLPQVHELLAAGQFRLARIFEMAPTRIVDASLLLDIDPGLASLRNVNTPEDYEAAQRESGPGKATW